MRKIWCAIIVNVVLAAGTGSAQDVTIRLFDRHGHATPVRHGFSQPTQDSLVITLTGVAVAGGHPFTASQAEFDFDVQQCFEVVFEKPGVKTAKMSLEGRVIGLLRSHCRGGGSAQEAQGCARVLIGDLELLGLCTPAHLVAGGENLSINDRSGPLTGPISPGRYTLQQRFHISAHHPLSLLPCTAASAEFAPDPALDPLWISYWEPFHGAQKKDFGFQITLKVAPEKTMEMPADNDEKKAK
jgi:hypothetical protein